MENMKGNGVGEEESTTQTLRTTEFCSSKRTILEKILPAVEHHRLKLFECCVSFELRALNTV